MFLKSVAVCRSGCSLVSIAVAIAAGLFAQAPEQIPPPQQSSAEQLTPFLPSQQQRQYQACTPADYGDPSVECVSANQRSSYAVYDPYNDIDGFPRYGTQQSNAQIANYGLRYATQRDQFEETPREPNLYNYVKEPPTEFQRYIAASTGQMLEIFGAPLFERVPATFAPADHMPVAADYVIAPGDELQLTVWGQLNLSRRFVVDKTGQVILPDAGPISVVGLNYGQVGAVFKSAMARFYKNFDLTVTLGRLHSIQIYVVGDARRPGSYTVGSLSTLVNAIFVSGGPSSRGSMRDIQLKRGNKTVCHFDLYDLLIQGDKSKDAQLVSGDVILIPSAGPRVAIAGSIEHPAIYELRDGSTLREILRLADGLSPMADSQEAILDSIADGAALKIRRIQLNPAGLATELHNGDIIRLLAVVPRFNNAITLRGNVADPGRFPWHAGMRLADLIPNKEALLTRDYWKERNRLAADGLSSTREEFSSEEDQRSRSEFPSTVDPPNSASSTQVAMLNARNLIPQPAFREQDRNFQADSSLGAATGASKVAPLRDFLPHNIVQPAAPEIDWQYAAIERTDNETLATRIIPFRLGDLVLAHDPSQNLLLEPGDVVTIFSKADFSVPRAEQAKQVRVEGEIGMAGVYTLLPGETLRQLVSRAGGLTQNAYLYGAQFTRESTRREQQKRYDDFLAQLDREMTESAANLSARVISPQQALTAQSSVASQHDLIDRLKKVPVDGRIVLNLEPTSRGVSALPDLPLENGDRLYVPSRPSTVNVIGTVSEQATFLYEEDLRVADYLKKAGGATRSADKSHMFVVRADGSVVSRRAVDGVLFARGFDTLSIYPGDTLVVPTYINKTTFARSLMDWSQIFSNLALGAAAVNVLH